MGPAERVECGNKIEGEKLEVIIMSSDKEVLR